MHSILVLLLAYRLRLEIVELAQLLLVSLRSRVRLRQSRECILDLVLKLAQLRASDRLKDLR